MQKLRADLWALSPNYRRECRGLHHKWARPRYGQEVWTRGKVSARSHRFLILTPDLYPNAQPLLAYWMKPDMVCSGHTGSADNRLTVQNVGWRPPTWPSVWPDTPPCRLVRFIPATPICLGDIHNMPTRSKFVFFQGFLNFLSKAPKFRSVRGGMCILFEIYEKGRFRNVWVRGGELTIFFSTEAKLFGLSEF